MRDQLSPQAPADATLPADLQALIRAWADLPDALKAGIVAVVRSAKP